MIALIVDDHPLSRRGIATLLRDDLGADVVLEAPNANVALALASERRPDLVLMDMRIPDSLPARELCAQLRGSLPSAWIVLVTAFDRAAEIRECLQAGANGCLLKDTGVVDLTTSIRHVMAGETVIDPRIAQKVAVDLATGGKVRGTPRLTAREREVLALLSEGRSNRQIAEQLVISETTVKGYVSQLLTKLDVSTRLEAVVSADRSGLL